MDEELGPISIEFVINNNLLKADAAQAEATLQGVTSRVEAGATSAAAAIQKLVNKGGFSDSAAEVQAYADSLQAAGDTGRVALSGTDELIRALNADLEAGVITAAQFQTEVEAIAAAETYWAEQTAVTNAEQVEQLGLLEELKVTLTQLQALKLTAQSPQDLKRINLAIQETEAEVTKFSNLGKKGFDEFGNKVKQSAGFVNTAWGGLRKLAQILPGIGIAGIIAFATGPVIEWLSALFKGRDALNQVKQNLQALIDVQKQAAEIAGSGLASLKLYYKAATDVNSAMADRIAAANELKKLYPDEFANVSELEIANGKLAGSYDMVTKSILAQAQAQASLKKITELTSQIQEINFQQDQRRAKLIDDINSAKRRGNIPSGTGSQSSISGGGASVISSVITLQDQVTGLSEYATKDIKALEEQKEVYQKQVDYLLNAAGGAAKIAQQLLNGNKLISDPLKQFDDIIKNANGPAVLEVLKKSLQAKLDALAPNDAQIKIYQDKIRKVEELLKAYSPKTTDGKSAENAAAEALKRQQNLLQQIFDVNDSYRRKELTADQMAIQAVVDKYDQLRAKITEFNANPKNVNKIGDSILTRIDAAENSAVDTQEVRNQNKHIAEDIEVKKKMYADYEAYKAKVGSDSANMEYADLLKSGKDFGDYLNTIYQSADKLYHSYASDVSGAAQERRDLVQKQIDQNREAQKKALQNLLEDTATYEEQRQAILETGADAEKKLLDAGQNERAAQVRKNTQDELTALDEAQVKKLDAYKELFSGVYTLTQSQTRRDIAAIQTYIDTALKAGKITKEAYDKINHELKNATNLADSDLPEKFIEVGSALQQWGSELSYFDDTLGHVLGTLGSVVSGIGSIKGNLNTLGSDSATSLSKLSAGLGIVGTAIGVVTTVVGLFSNAKQKAEQEQYNLDLQIKAIEAVNKGLQRQLELTKQIYGPERVSGYLKALADIAAAQEKAFNTLSGKIQLTGDKLTDEAIGKYNSGQDISNFWKEAIENGEKTGKVFTLAGKSLEDLQKLMDSGKLDASTQAIIQSLIDLQQQAIDTQNAIKSEFTGSTFDDLVSGIKDLLFNVNATAQDWGNDFTKIIHNSVEKGFETQFIEKQMQAFYDDLAKYTQADGGILSKDSIAKLQAEYDKIKGDLQTELQQVQQATGITLSPIDNTGSTTSSPSAISGQISGITETQANALEGIGRGMQLSLVKSNELLEAGVANQEAQLAEMKKQTLLQMQIAANTKRTADNTDVLPTMASSLTSIDKNTKDTSGNILRAAGITK
ncbi:hypothetical protein [Mucilaginibacter sp. L3T2-6]|uniref:hypothetical protein n=1 Tax=Mucilaginibacter sp. L3T2-6 TaxID=3062491 RepID=UPI00267490A3|nr:hypothetical protein [Mucilaginibacter sp. L3T2-6]MDO3641978.1 hypothetical protein [Mucilaginibacter sp. L3T2-6]MDV6214344.1 hypothetical protein [Mucilaginibacter sp. L3T2-6]